MSGLLRALTLPALASACALACSDLEPAPGRPGGGVADGGGGDTPADARADDRFDTANEMIAAFGSCMSYTDWVNARLDRLPLQDTIEGEICAACHAAQGTGAVLSEDPVLTWDHHRRTPSIYKIALPLLDPATGEPSDVIPNDRYVAKGQEHESGHPEYRLDHEIEIGLGQFFENTYVRFTTQEGDCAPDAPE